MWFWWFMAVCSLIIPILMIISGRLMYKNCPKEINRVYGYRTKRSMKNMDTWKFAHEYCGCLWYRAGLIMLIPSVAAYIPLYGGDIDIIGTAGAILTVIQLIILIAPVILTERKLKNNFDNDRKT